MPHHDPIPPYFHWLAFALRAVFRRETRGLEQINAVAARIDERTRKVSNAEALRKLAEKVNL